MWSAAAAVYRSWAAGPSGNGGADAGASWMRAGPIAQRPADFPRWFAENHLWVNSGWQCHDVFNETEGDPQVVLDIMKKVVERFDLRGCCNASLALHWYEWDTLGYAPGSHYSRCATEATCGFDTHHPEHFPPRVQ